MKKIVILTGDCGEDEWLTSCLESLFPECEIEILPGGKRECEGSISALGTDAAKEG